jgi:hypothetical protein
MNCELPYGLLNKKLGFDKLKKWNQWSLTGKKTVKADTLVTVKVEFMYFEIMKCVALLPGKVKLGTLTVYCITLSAIMNCNITALKGSSMALVHWTGQVNDVQYTCMRMLWYLCVELAIVYVFVVKHTLIHTTLMSNELTVTDTHTHAHAHTHAFWHTRVMHT